MIWQATSPKSLIYTFTSLELNLISCQVKSNSCKIESTSEALHPHSETDAHDRSALQFILQFRLGTRLSLLNNKETDATLLMVTFNRNGFPQRTAVPPLLLEPSGFIFIFIVRFIAANVAGSGPFIFTEIFVTAATFIGIHSPPLCISRGARQDGQRVSSTI